MEGGLYMERYRKVFNVIGAVVAIVLVGLVIKNYWAELVLLFNLSPTNQAELVNLVHSHGVVDVLLLLVLIALLCVIPGAPNSVVCIFTGVCYGPLFGFLISWAGDILGNCLLRVTISRSKVSTKTRHKRIYQYLVKQRYPVLGLALAFAIPIVPNIVTNFAAVKLRVQKSYYLTAVALGTIPTTFIYAYSGHAISALKFKQLIPLLVGFILLCLLYFAVKFGVQKYRQRD